VVGIKSILTAAQSRVRNLFQISSPDGSGEYQAELNYLKQVIPDFMSDSLMDASTGKNALIVSAGRLDAKTEGIYAKAFEKAGFEVSVIGANDPYIAKIFALYGIDNILVRGDYFKNISLDNLKAQAKKYIEGASEKEILRISKNGINVGKFAAATFIRRTMQNGFDLKSDNNRSIFVKELALSLQAAEAAENILDNNKVDLLFVNDRGCTPTGQLFEACLSRGIPVITRNSSHKSGSDVLKKYLTVDMGAIHPISLSSGSWERFKNMPWNDDMWDELKKDHASTYRSGDWFSEVGTQFNKDIYSKSEIGEKLGLDSNKKTAVIFPHIFWDGTFFWGEDLFDDYYDWFINTIKAAAKNTNLNWIINIHPANVVKSARANYHGEIKELVAIRRALGALPDHMKVNLPDSDINTFSYFSMMDYCLTVRGTIGLEAAAFGINTFTAGTGRYNNLGFTHDFTSQDAYLKCLASLEKVPPMSEKAVNLARRYAYGIFLLRPIRLDILEYGYKNDKAATILFKPLFETKEQFVESSFAQSINEFIKSGREDYLNRPVNPKIPEFAGKSN